MATVHSHRDDTEAGECLHACWHQALVRIPVAQSVSRVRHMPFVQREPMVTMQAEMMLVNGPIVVPDAKGEHLAVVGDHYAVLRSSGYGYHLHGVSVGRGGG